MSEPQIKPRSQIAEEVKSALGSPLLRQVVDARVALGVKKYGQTLDDNEKPDRAKAVHLIQELLDAMQYVTWHGWGKVLPFGDVILMQLAHDADYVAAEYPDLTMDELLFSEGHSGAGRAEAAEREVAADDRDTHPESPWDVAGMP